MLPSFASIFPSGKCFAHGSPLTGRLMSFILSIFFLNFHLYLFQFFGTHWIRVWKSYGAMFRKHFLFGKMLCSTPIIPMSLFIHAHLLKFLLIVSQRILRNLFVFFALSFANIFPPGKCFAHLVSAQCLPLPLYSCPLPTIWTNCFANNIAQLIYAFYFNFRKHFPSGKIFCSYGMSSISSFLYSCPLPTF